MHLCLRRILCLVASILNGACQSVFYTLYFFLSKLIFVSQDLSFLSCVNIAFSVCNAAFILEAILSFKGKVSEFCSDILPDLLYIVEANKAANGATDKDIRFYYISEMLAMYCTDRLTRLFTNTLLRLFTNTLLRSSCRSTKAATFCEKKKNQSHEILEVLAFEGLVYGILLP